MEIPHAFQKPLNHGSVNLILNEIALASHSKHVQLRLGIVNEYYPNSNRRKKYFDKPGGIFYSKNIDGLEFVLECEDSDKDSLPNFSKIVFRPSETNEAEETKYAKELVSLIPKAEILLPDLAITHRETMIKLPKDKGN